MNPPKLARVIDIHALKNACSNCSLREMCLPTGLSQGEIEKLDQMVYTRKRVKRGDSVYRSEEKFGSLYAIRSGFFKTTLVMEDGRDQVTGFQMAGLEELSRELYVLQQHFHKVMSREIVREHGVMLLLGSMRAEERLAAFLLNLSQRFTSRGYSPSEFNLRMTREEIGSYLGLKLETVSRTFSKFQEDGLIGVQQKNIRILDSEGLKSVLGREPV